jgi:putative inorganic carbon (HCO3(-)) transporter
MPARRVWRPPTIAWVLLGLLGLALTAKLYPEKLEGRWMLVGPAMIVCGVLALRRIWELPPAAPLTAAVVLSVFSGAWSQIGLGGFPLDRLMALIALAMCFLAAPGTARMPRLEVRGVHLLMALTLMYAFGSAAAAGTLDTEAGRLTLFDQLGLMPYLLFFIAPSVYAGERERSMLLAALVGLGAYLGITATFEILGPHSLVFPSYIVEADATKPGVLRAGGPFGSAIAMGCATFACAVAAAIAYTRWQGRAKALAVACGALSLFGCFLTLQRGVWIGAILAIVLTGLLTRQGRRWLVPGLALGVVAIALALALSPSLSQRASDRAGSEKTVLDRRNQMAAGMRMIEAKPLFGFGLDRYRADAEEYFRQPATYPMVGYYANTLIGFPQQPLPLHNTYLAYAVELGLVGLLLWLAALLWAVLEGALRAGPRALRPWKLGLLAVAVCVLVMSLVNPHEPPFAMLLLLVWAGVATGARPLGAPAPERGNGRGRFPAAAPA